MTNLNEQAEREEASALALRLAEYNQQIETLELERDAVISQLRELTIRGMNKRKHMREAARLEARAR